MSGDMASSSKTLYYDVTPFMYYVMVKTLSWLQDLMTLIVVL